METGALHEGDIAIIIFYFVFILFIGLWTSRKNRGSVGGYFLAGRNMNWIPVGASLFASNVGSLHFVGLAGSGAEAGLSVGTYELDAIFVLIMLGWLFLPVYIASGVFTMPEYIRRRFGGQRIRIYLAVLSLLVYIFTKISADLYAGAIFIEQALKWDIYYSIILLLAVAAIFTITGGLTAVIWTDFIQTGIMIIGAVTLCILSFVEVGGLEGLWYLYPQAIPDTALNQSNVHRCGYPRHDALHLIRDPVNSDLPWPGIIGLTVNSIWYWCADQVIVQRALAAKNFSHAKAGTLFAGYIKILPLFILILPGMIARVLYTNEVACIDPDVCERVCSSRSGCSNVAYPLLVLRLMPVGAKGLMLAVMLSALMSSLTSIFNSSSTIFTMDIWRRIRKGASETELMIVGRLCVLVLVVVSILWIPIIQASQGSQLFVYIQQVSSYLQPPICAVYLLSIFWPRTNEQGAFWSLCLGLIVGATRFVMEFYKAPPGCGEPDERLGIIKNFHYLYFAIFLFVFTILVCVIVSLLTKPLEEENLYRLTFWSRHSTEERKDIDTGSMCDMDDVTLPAVNGSTPNLDEEVETRAPLPCWKKAAYWVCGVENLAQEQPVQTPEDKLQAEKRAAQLVDISESPRVKRILNANAVILMCIGIFIWAFFA